MRLPVVSEAITVGEPRTLVIQQDKTIQPAGNYMMELSEISVGDELVLEKDGEWEPVVVGKVGTRCVYATNYERGNLLVAAPQRFSRPASLSEG